MTHATVHHALLALLDEERSSLVMVAVAARLLAADATFNLWFSRVAKSDSHRTEDSILQLVEDYARIERSGVEACAVAASMPRAERERLLVPTLRALTIELQDMVGDFDPTATP